MGWLAGRGVAGAPGVAERGRGRRRLPAPHGRRCPGGQVFAQAGRTETAAENRHGFFQDAALPIAQLLGLRLQHGLHSGPGRAQHGAPACREIQRDPPPVRVAPAPCQKPLGHQPVHQARRRRQRGADVLRHRGKTCRRLAVYLGQHAKLREGQAVAVVAHLPADEPDHRGHRIQQVGGAVSGRVAIGC